jgi:cyclase
MREIGPDVYVETAFQGGNVGLIVTPEGAVLVDTPMMPWEARQWAATVKRTTKQPIRFVINTDHHTEHILGNQFFAAPVVGHELAWKEITGYSEAYRQRLIDSLQVGDPQRDAELKELVLVPPKVTVTARLTLFLGDRCIYIIHVGGHCPSSLLVYAQREGVLFAGDVVVRGVHPTLGQANSKTWLRALNRIRRMSCDVLVPGIGEPGDKEITTDISTYIRDIRAGVRRQFAAGRSKAETYNQLLSVVSSFPISEGRKDKIEQQFKAGINQVYEEIKSEKSTGNA